MSLREEPIELTAALPDGRQALVRVGFLDSYIPPKEQQTIGLELVVDGETQAALNTVLEPHQAREGEALARKIAAGLESGTLEPTAAALEPLADEPY